LDQAKPQHRYEESTSDRELKRDQNEESPWRQQKILEGKTVGVTLSDHNSQCIDTLRQWDKQSRRHECHEANEIVVGLHADTVIDPGTVVVEPLHALVTDGTMSWAGRPYT
jgi:hypothetical protein